MLNRISNKFEQLKINGQKAFIPFLTSGDPDYETSLTILKGLPGVGANIIELGMPFSDPCADGPIITASYERALAQGQNLLKTLSMVKEFRVTDKNTPIILYGYFNPIMQYGVNQFLADSKESGVDGFIIVDLTCENDGEFYTPAVKNGFSVIRLIAPNTSEARMDVLLDGAKGFAYYVAVAGPTGTISATSESIQEKIKVIKRHTHLPVCVGVGISTEEKACAAAKTAADAVVVGSSIVKRISTLAPLASQDRRVEDVLNYVKGFASAVHNGAARPSTSPQVVCKSSLSGGPI